MSTGFLWDLQHKSQTLAVTSIDMEVEFEEGNSLTALPEELLDHIFWFVLDHELEAF